MEKEIFQKKYNILLKEFESHLQKSLYNPNKTQLFDAAEYALATGGKRIRPMLTLLTNNLVSNNSMLIMDSAIAIEILHNFTLLHDDIMDNSDIRRGLPTVYKKWNMPFALLAGDWMIGQAFKLVNNSGKASVNVLITALLEVCEGQQLDMEFNDAKIVSLDNYLEMINLKTAALIKASVKLGIAENNLDINKYNKLVDFAHNLGIAFQIQDDMLDFTADNLRFGKKIGQDVLERKKTYPIIKARELAKDNEDIVFLNDYFNGNIECNEEKVKDFINLFDKLNIFEIANEYINKLINTATSMLYEFENNEAREMLIFLTEEIGNRKF